MDNSKLFIATGFDGKNYWPFKVIKKTKARATIIECSPCGKEKGEPVSRKIDSFSGEPTVQFNRFETVYLERPYSENDFMKYSDI